MVGGTGRESFNITSNRYADRVVASFRQKPTPPVRPVAGLPVGGCGKPRLRHSLPFPVVSAIDSVHTNWLDALEQYSLRADPTPTGQRFHPLLPSTRHERFLPRQTTSDILVVLNDKGGPTGSPFVRLESRVRSAGSSRRPALKCHIRKIIRALFP